MEILQTRILLRHTQGATIAYFYNRESFDLLNIDRQTYDNSQFVEIGQNIEYNGVQYVVRNINIKLEEKTFQMNNEYGVNLYSPTDASDFNLKIGVFVDSL